jgi:two-component system response regulator HydG
MAASAVDRYWERVLNTMNEALMIISPQGQILTVNRAFEEMTGYAADEVAGQPCTLLECDACERALHNHGGRWCKLFDLDTHQIRRCRCSILRKDGTYVPALKNASVLEDENGQVLGAVETLTDISEIDRLDREVAALSRRIQGEAGFFGIVGHSTAMRKVFDVIEKAAASDAPVVIQGESGTGKELVARAIHQCGTRRSGPYVELNCAALNPALLESELFGHIKGSFTGAHRDRRGRFETADGGDLFLDEIGDIPPTTQVKLLRVLETQQFERVGDSRPIAVDVRIITATHQNLLQLISQDRFREDLYFRINVIPIHLPPLRERRSDIPILTDHFIQDLRKRSGKTIAGVSKGVLQQFLAHDWPGNVRELKSALAYAFAVAETGPITLDHLPPQLTAPAASAPAGVLGLSPKEAREKQALIAALRRTNGNQTRAARELDVNRVTVWNRIRKYRIDLHRILSETTRQD